MKSLFQKPALVLIADSDEDNLYLVSTVVQDMGLRAVTASSGDAAVQACQRYRPSLALLETRFSDIHESEMMSAIRKIRSRRLMAAIAVTSAAMPGDRDRCLSIGFDSYIAKPYHIAELEQLICKYMRHKLDRSSLSKRLSPHLKTVQD